MPHASRLPVPYAKMHGTGNDFVVLDLVSDTPPNLESSYLHNEVRAVEVQSEARVALSRFLHQHLFHTPREWEFPKGVLRRIANRHLGVGCDQIVALVDGGFGHAHAASQCRAWYDEHATDISGGAPLVVPPDACVSSSHQQPGQGRLAMHEVAWVAARIFNGHDGCEVGMCANALRCIALYWLMALLLEHPLMWSAVLDDANRSRPVVCVYLPGSHRKVVCEVRLSEESRLAIREALATQQQRATESAVGAIDPLSIAQLACLLEDGESLVTVNIGCPVSVASLVPFVQEVDVERTDGTYPATSSFHRGAFSLDKTEVISCVAASSACSAYLEALSAKLLGAFVVGFGNPHLVLVLENDGGSPVIISPSRQHASSSLPVDSSDSEAPPSLLLSDGCVDAVGWQLCYAWRDRFPKGTNVEFVHVTSATASFEGGCDASIRMRVYERGAGRTLSCGSGACAAAVAVVSHAAPSSLNGSITVTMDGGEAEVQVMSCNSTTGAEHSPFVQFTGPAAFSGTGSWLPTFA